MVTASILPLWMPGSLGGLGAAIMLLAPLLARRGQRKFGLPRPLERRVYLLRVLSGECSGLSALCLCGSFYLSPEGIAFVLLAAGIVGFIASLLVLDRALSVWRQFKAAQGISAARVRL